MTDDERENCIMELFNDALELEQSERFAFLNRAESDSSIREEVRFMIEAHERAGDFLADPDIEGAERPGEFIGRYRLHRLIGEGGFGRVYLAHQREPMVRNVALKIIKLGMDTRQVMARFEAERQALALMNHPNIATVLDAGATDSGRPYFVMELVGDGGGGGVSITEYCDQNDLSLTQRLDLFRQVCSAVQHAHTKGIIHRDIKPTNVLVSRNGNHNGMAAPKVIDFGIAKATGARLNDETFCTENRQLVGTPEYMSPEQADVNAADIDTRSDVYSLGVLLYELLTGATPYDRKRLRSAAYGDVQRIIRDEEPPKPSTRFSTMEADTAKIIAAQRDLEPHRLAMHLRGDLDWITLKALEKQRERRYGSAAELSEDIRRHLDHEPVLACPPSLTYRAGKFIRRHSVAVFATTLIMIAMIGGAVGIVTGRLQARDSATQTAAVNDFMRQVLTSADPDHEGADVRFVDVLDNATKEASIRFAGQPALEAQVRDLLGSVYGRLAMWSRAEVEFRTALNLWESCAGRDDPRTLSSSVQLGQVLVNQERGRDAEQFLDGLIPRLHRVFGIDQEQSIEGEGIVAGMLALRGRFDQSESMLRAALSRAEAQGVSAALRFRLLSRLSKTLLDKSTTALSRETALNECRAVTTQLLEQSLSAGKAGTWHSLTARLTLANIAMRCNQFAEVAAQARQLLEDSHDRLSECHDVRRGAMHLLAAAQAKLGDTQEPADLYLQLLDCIRSDGSNATRLMVSLTDAIQYLFKDKRWREGEACARELIQTVHELGSTHVTSDYGELFLAICVLQQGRMGEAGAIFESLLARYDQIQEPDRSWLNLGYASYLIKRGEFELAERRLKMLIPSIDPQEFTYAEYLDDYLRVFVALYEAWGKPELAQEYRQLLDHGN